MPVVGFRRALLVVGAAVLAASLAGCGNKHAARTHAETEGLYLNVGPLIYQVQISRQLNPRDTEDRAYLQGLPAEQSRLAPDEVFFGVFMRVQNATDKPQHAAEEFEIVDTEENEIKPVPIPASNPFAYHAREIAPGGLLPSADSAAGTGVVGQGALLLFRVKLSSLANRPLELKIESPEVPHKEGTVQLDV